jgi:hypothetical protein
MWPYRIRARAERMTLLIVLSVLSSYASAFALATARFVA